MQEIMKLENLLDRKYGRDAKRYLGSPEYQQLQRLIAAKQDELYAKGLSYMEEYNAYRGWN